MTEVASFTCSVPYVPEAEQYVLGAILLHPEAIGLVASAGGASLFFDGAHAEIYRQAADRDRRGLLVSPVALSQWAKGYEPLNELGGAAYLARVAGISPGMKTLPHYIETLAEMKAARDLAAVVNTAAHDLTKGEKPTADIAGALEASLATTERKSSRAPVSMMQATIKAVENAVSAMNGEETGAVATGIDALDRILSRLYPGDVIVLGGRPSMGKTAVALSIGLNVARAGHGVVIGSFEMNPEALAERAIAEASPDHGAALNYTSMRQGNLTPQQVDSMKSAARAVSELPITFLSREFTEIGALFAGAKQAKRMLGDNMKLLIVDYLQLMRSSKSNRFEEITDISIALKSLAGQLNIPVIALSQLSRKCEERADKRPMLSDLRESGQIEQDADAVLFCFRHEYYLEREEPDQGNHEKHEAWRRAKEAARNRLEIIVAKQRQGAIGTAHVFCNPALNRIWEA